RVPAGRQSSPPAFLNKRASWARLPLDYRARLVGQHFDVIDVIVQLEWLIDFGVRKERFQKCIHEEVEGRTADGNAGDRHQREMNCRMAFRGGDRGANAQRPLAFEESGKQPARFQFLALAHLQEIDVHEDARSSLPQREARVADALWYKLLSGVTSPGIE